LCRAKQVATFGFLSGLKGHHQGPELHTLVQNTQNACYFEKGCEVRDLDDVILNR
jgi:hypothetical protein